MVLLSEYTQKQTQSVSLNSYFLDESDIELLKTKLFYTGTIANLYNTLGDWGQLIQGIIMYPFDIPLIYYTHISSPYIVAIGDKELDHSAGGSSLPVTGYRIHSLTPYIIRFDFNARRFVDSFINYTPYTQTELYIPFYGFIDIDNYLYSVYDIHLMYSIDFTTGIADIKVYYTEQDMDNHINEHIIFNNVCNIGISIPVASMDTTYYRNMAVNMAKSVIGVGISAAAFATGNVTIGASAAAATTQSVSDVITEKTRGQSGRLQTSDKYSETHTTTTSPVETNSSYTTRRPYVVAHAANNLVDAIGNGFMLSTNGSIRTTSSPNNVFATYRHPFIRIHTKRVYYPTNFGHQVGFMCGKSYKLKNLKGYNVIGACHIDINALKSEVDEIEELLKSGVIINNVIDTPTEQDYINYNGYKEPFIPTEPGVEPSPPEPPLEGYLTPVLNTNTNKFYITQAYDVIFHEGIDLTSDGGSLNIYLLRESGLEYRQETDGQGRLVGLGCYIRAEHTEIEDGLTVHYIDYYGHLEQGSWAYYRNMYDGHEKPAGTKIGEMGMTGTATGVHLHFTVRKNYTGDVRDNIPVNPYTNFPFLPRGTGRFNGYLPS